jgi:hypothetical protein
MLLRLKADKSDVINLRYCGSRVRWIEEKVNTVNKQDVSKTTRKTSVTYAPRNE